MGKLLLLLVCYWLLVTYDKPPISTRANKSTPCFCLLIYISPSIPSVIISSILITNSEIISCCKGYWENYFTIIIACASYFSPLATHQIIKCVVLFPEYQVQNLCVVLLHFLDNYLNNFQLFSI